MKRLIALILCCLLLCGCGTGAGEETTAHPTEAEATIPAVEPTEPGGSYDPDSLVEEQTGGAVRVYPLEMSQVYAACSMGEDLLIFSGVDSTNLTKLSGNNLYVTAAAHVNAFIHPEEASVQVSARGVSYYCQESCEIVLLDTDLREIDRIPLPEDIVGSPVMTEDRAYVYYCTENSVRELDLETGISRMLKEISYPTQTVETVLLDGSVVCLELVEDGSWTSLYLSTENGGTLWEGPDNVALTSDGDSWYAQWLEGILQAFVYSLDGGEEQMLVPEELDASGNYLADLGYLVTTTVMEDPQVGVVLDCYDLSSGLRISSLTLDNVYYPWCVDGSQETGELYVLAEDVAGTRAIYRWDVAALPTGDETVYSGPHYTLDNPDLAGLADCEAYAADIGSRYGVEILVGFDAVAVQPFDYTLTVEYQVPVLRQQLEKLDALLSVYPEGMLKTAMEATADGILRISIVREILGVSDMDNLDSAGGLCFWMDNNVYIAEAVTTDRGYTLYHELFHALETRLLSNSDACYDWEYLNPKGFEYSYNYSDYLSLDGSEYLEDETRYFIDVYSMTFPTEDRARIMEYAMTEGNEYLFQSEAMQKKLKALCVGIREAYGLKKSPEIFLWEQYLNEPLAPSK